MFIKKKTFFPVFISAVLSASALVFMNADERYVATPGLVCFVLVFWLGMNLWDRDNKVPFYELGMICALATLVYTVYPLINYWAGGMQFGFFSDARLSSYDPSPSEIGFFHLRHSLYLFSFVIFYSLFRGRGKIEVGNVSAPSRASLKFIVILFLILSGYFILLQLATGFNLNPSYESDSRANYLSAIASLPLILLQISVKLWGILFVFKLAVLFIVVSRCRQKKWLIILFIWLAAEIIQALIIKGARTNLVLFFIATALLYHRMIKPLSLKFLVTSGIVLFILFISLGLYRSYSDKSSFQEDLAQSDNQLIVRGNEFQSLLGTAYDVLQLKESGAHLPWYLYINDIINILPPQQLVPFEKIPASEWYLREIGMSEMDVGFMWGVISQSIVGLDWIELFIRGSLLGFILARIHCWYIRHQTGFIETITYTYLCVRVYYTFRDTTFSILTNLVWEIIPFFILMRLGASLTTSFRNVKPGLTIT